MLPAQFQERFRQIMGVKIEEVARSVQEDFSRASGDAARTGQLSSSSTLGLIQRRRILTIERRIAAAVEAIKQLVEVMQIPYSDTLGGELKSLVQSSAPSDHGERWIDSDSPRLDAPLKSRFQKELRMAQGAVLNKARLEIDLLVDSLRAKSTKHVETQSDQIGRQLDAILLQEQQKELLLELVRADHACPPEKKGFKFTVATTGGSTTILHGGFATNHPAIISDIEALGDVQLLRLKTTGRGTTNFSITPLGFRYAQWMQEKSGTPVQRVTKEIRTYMDSDTFQKEYPLAYQRWAQAEAALWGEDSANQFTTIGHLCREAIQEFAEVLVNKYKPQSINPDKTKTIDRIRAVLKYHENKLSGTVKLFLGALLAYWGTLSDLIQRQEHGASKEGEPIIREDAKRVVLHTAVVMWEFDRSLSKTK